MNNFTELRRCESCGGELISHESEGFWQCRYCGSKYYLKENKGESLILALNRASELRQKSDFDGAILEYTVILKSHPEDDEANWGMFIARCGIEYVKDDRTGNLIPTCHRTLKGDVLEDPYYQKAIQNAAEKQIELYEKQAKAIARLQKKIKQQMDDEEEYDVFISFKAKDENGYPTRDSVVARNIYDKLHAAGIKTFFSEVTLSDRMGDEYEPIIYKALYSCKYFILVTTAEAHTNAIWVKNEWARFRDRMADENMGHCAFAVFDGKDCIPSFLRGSQGFDLAKYPNGGYEIAVSDYIALHLKKDQRHTVTDAIIEEAEAFKANINKLKAAKRTPEWCELVAQYREILSSASIDFRTACISIDPLLREMEKEAKSIKDAAEKAKARADAIAEKAQLKKKEKVKQEKSNVEANAYRRLGVRFFDALGRMYESEGIYWETLYRLDKIKNGKKQDELAMAIFGEDAATVFSHLVRTKSNGQINRDYPYAPHVERVTHYQDTMKEAGKTRQFSPLQILSFVLLLASIASVPIFSLLYQAWGNWAMAAIGIALPIICGVAIWFLYTLTSSDDMPGILWQIFTIALAILAIVFIFLNRQTAYISLPLLICCVISFICLSVYLGTSYEEGDMIFDIIAGCAAAAMLIVSIVWCVSVWGPTPASVSIADETVIFRLDRTEDVFIAEAYERAPNLSKLNAPKAKTVIICEGYEGLYAESLSKCDSMETLYIPSSVKSIAANALLECETLKTLYIGYNSDGSKSDTPPSLEYLGCYAFRYSPINTIYYNGTVADWEAIEKEDYIGLFSSDSWRAGIGKYKVICNDGVLEYNN